MDYQFPPHANAKEPGVGGDDRRSALLAVVQDG